LFALFGAKNTKFFEIYGVSARARRLSQSDILVTSGVTIFRNFVRSPLWTAPNHTDVFCIITFCFKATRCNRLPVAVVETRIIQSCQVKMWGKFISIIWTLNKCLNNQQVLKTTHYPFHSGLFTNVKLNS